MSELHIGLVHYPIFNKNKDIVATTITHFDVHDIARVCRSYGVCKYHLIHPSEEQLMFVERLKEHWLVGAGGQINPLRAEAMKRVVTASSIEQVKVQEGIDLTYATSAKNYTDYPMQTFDSAKKNIKSAEKTLILFGTGSGLVSRVFDQCDALIEPIVGFEGSDFRHLSVRAAVAIVLDRIHRA